MMKIITRLFFLTSLFLPLVANAEVVDVPARGTSTRILVESPGNPRAVVAIFAGGKGIVNIKRNGRHGMRGNFAVRTRSLLLEHGIATAVIDAPEDMMDDLRRHRDSDAYAESMGAVIRYLKDRFRLPVWLHGTSRGTVSIAAIATKLGDGPEKPDGLVFSASVFRQGNRGFNVFDFDLEKISGLVLILHHKQDACFVTPAEDIPKFRDELKNATIKTVLFEGGSARGGACRARHHHGFNGIEDDVIAAIAEFIIGQK